MKMTPELKHRLNKTINIYECSTCEGCGVVGQSPTFPEGSMCEDCNGTGFINDGALFNDLRKDIFTTVDGYIKQFAEQPNGSHSA